MDSTISVDKAMTATIATSLVNKAALHWVKKVINRRLQKTGILDTGATSGAAPEEDEDVFLRIQASYQRKSSCSRINAQTKQ
jgi:hypothetical protein